MAKHACDVSGCNRTRFRWQRICNRCYAILPRRISFALINAWHGKDRTVWRAMKKEAGRLLVDNLASETRRLTGRQSRLARSMPAITAQQAFQNNQRLLGEHD